MQTHNTPSPRPESPFQSTLAPTADLAAPFGLAGFVALYFSTYEGDGCDSAGGARGGDTGGASADAESFAFAAI